MPLSFKSLSKIAGIKGNNSYSNSITSYSLFETNTDKTVKNLEIYDFKATNSLEIFPFDVKYTLPKSGLIVTSKPFDSK